MKKIKNKYLSSITTLVSGSMLAQLMTFVCSPIITRLFSTEALGIYSLVTGSVTMFGSVMAFRYEMCIVSEEKEDRVYPLLKLCMMICTAMSLLIAAGYTIYFSVIRKENPVLLAVIAGLLTFQIGIINIATAYNNRKRDYKLITKTYVQRVSAQNICNILAGAGSMGAIGLSVSHVIGYSAGIRGQCAPLWKERTKITKSSFKEVRQVFRDNIKQLTFSTPAAFFNGLSYSLINYFIEALYSTAIVGYYSISYRILGLPMTVISTNVSRVFLEQASREYEEKGNFLKSFRTTLFMLIALGIPMAAVLMIFAPWACELFFGSGWTIAGVYIRLLTPMFILRFIAGGLNTAAIISGKQQYDFIIQSLLVIYAFASFAISGFYSMSVESFLSILNLGFSIIYIIYIVIFWRCAKGR